MFDKCYKNIYILIVQFVPIDFHPVLRLVNSKFNRVIANKVCRLNRIMPYAGVSLLQFIQTQPHVYNFTIGTESSPYTLKSMLQAGLYNRLDIMDWMKQNSEIWKSAQDYLDVNSMLKLYTRETLTYMINTFFIYNTDCCEFLLEHGSNQQIKLFLDGQVDREFKGNEDVEYLLHALAVLTGDKHYVNLFESEYGDECWCVKKSAIRSLSIELIETYVEHNISYRLWLVTLNTNCLEVIQHIWNTREIEYGYKVSHSDITLSETTLNFLLSVNYKFKHSYIYDTLIELPLYRDYFEKIYQTGGRPSSHNYNTIFKSKYGIDQIKWLYEHGVAIVEYDGNEVMSNKDSYDGNIESFYDEIIYYDELFEVGSLEIFKFWHQLYYPKYVLTDETTFIDHILVNSIKYHRIDIVDYILQQGYHLDKNYLSTALNFSTFEMCQCLIDHGYEIVPEVDDVLNYCMKRTLAKPYLCLNYHEFFVRDPN